MKSDYEAKIAAAVNKIHDLENEQKQLEVKQIKLRDISQSAKSLKKKSFVLTSEIVNRLIDRITINSDKKIEVALKFESEFGVTE
jgi:hypothetical protein